MSKERTCPACGSRAQPGSYGCGICAEPPGLPPLPSPHPAELYRAWCAAHGSPPEAHDNLVAWLRTLVLPRYQRVQLADHVCRQLFPDRAAELLIALECAGCFDP